MIKVMERLLEEVLPQSDQIGDKSCQSLQIRTRFLFLLNKTLMYNILKIALKPSCPRSYYSPALAPLQSTTLPPPLLPALIPSPGGQAGQTEK